MVVLVIKATFQIQPEVKVAEEQIPIVMADEFWSEKDYASIRYPSEITLAKPGTDVVMNSHAYAPDGIPAETVDVSLQIGACQKTVRVTGDREWTRLLGIPYKTPIEPFVKIPLTYERAWGGTAIHNEKPTKRKSDKVNPAGTGIVMRNSDKQREGMAVPNVIEPGFPKRKSTPAGFGAIRTHWKSRAKYQGTYNKQWLEKRCPLPPTDQNPLFQHAAHPDLISEDRLLGGETVSIRNADPGGRMQFQLPVIRLQTDLHFSRNPIQKKEAALDTVLLEPDQNRFTLLWKTVVDANKKEEKLQQIQITVIESNMSLEIENGK